MRDDLDDVGKLGDGYDAKAVMLHQDFVVGYLNGRIAELLAGVADLCGPRSRVAIRPGDSS
jgi:hypothetical protein